MEARHELAWRDVSVGDEKDENRSLMGQMVVNLGGLVLAVVRVVVPAMTAMLAEPVLM